MNNTRCFWAVTSPVGTQLQVDFTRFDTEQDFDIVAVSGSRMAHGLDEACLRWSLWRLVLVVACAQVFDGPTVHDSVLGKFSGNGLPMVVESTGGAVLLRFKSDAIYSESGWEAVISGKV